MEPVLTMDFKLDAPLMPILQTAEWGPDGDRPTIAYSTAYDADNPQALKISFGQDTGPAFAYPMLAEDSDVASMARESISNLAKDSQAFSDLQEVDIGDGDKIVIVAGSDLSSSVILLGPIRENIRERFELADGDPLYAAVPSRQCAIFAKCANPGKFMGMVDGMYNENVEENQAPLSPLVHVYDEKELIGILMVQSPA